MNKQTNTPELRFPEFKNEWKNNILKNMATTFSGGTPSSTNKSLYAGEIPFIRSGEINSLITEMKISQKALEKSSAKMVNEGDILYALYGATSGEVAISKIEGAINQAVLCIRTKQITSFLYQYLKLKKSNILNKYLQGGQGNLSAKIIKNIVLSMPDTKEQRKIGDFFSKLDRQIELEEKKLELLEQQKRGYIQKFFSQELRFKDANGNSYPDWSIKKIEDISKVNKGFTPNTKNDEYWDELNENWLSIAGMTQKYLYKGNKGITKKGASKHAKVDKDTLIMSFKLTLGKLAIVKEPIYTNEAICHFVWKESNVNTEYMYYYLNSINISTFGAQAVKGVTLNNDSINSIIVKLPVIQEQNKIAYFFNKLDKLIEKQSSKVELLKQRKQGLLQKMFV